MLVEKTNRIKMKILTIDTSSKNAIVVITENEEKIIDYPQNITNNVENVTESEELQILDFRVHVTQRQKFELREFLQVNNIKFEPVPKNN